MAISETGAFEVMEVDDDADLMLFAEDQDSNDISLHIDFAQEPKSDRKQQQYNQQPQKKQSSMPKSKKKGSRISVVVRKRPMNSKERNNNETDVTNVYPNESRITISEPKLKVDLTKYTQLHEFTFDHVFGSNVNNKQIYAQCVKPLFHTILRPLGNHKYAGKATCFGYGQTGSGKTYTLLGSEDSKTGKFVEGLYTMAVRDLFKYLPPNNKIEVSFYEIYGNKLYDLLCERKQILCREDGKQKVNIIGLTRIECQSVESLMNVITAGNEIRRSGSTGANDSSSRSHAILRMDILPIGGRLSFIDLAGSERGADTSKNNKQTRREGAEINKSLLALKECIRALDMNSLHKPFRGSKLTQVLKESFMGNSRTVMIANISPNSGSCENTLNTLRYAYRVKELKGDSNANANANNNENNNQKSMLRNASEPNLNYRNGPSRPSTAQRKRKMDKNSIKKNKKYKKMLKPPTKVNTNINVKREAASEGFDIRKKQNRISPPSSFLMNKQQNENKNVSVFSKKQLIKAHRKHIDEFMILIKEDMQLLKSFDKDEFDSNAYQKKLKNVLDRQTEAVQKYKAKVFN